MAQNFKGSKHFYDSFIKSFKAFLFNRDAQIDILRVKAGTSLDLVCLF